MPAAPSPPAAPSALPSDPLAPRASGSLRMRQLHADDETMRIERSPRAAPQPQPQPLSQPALAAPDQTDEEAVLPASVARSARLAVERAFWRGVAVGAGVMAALAAVALGALLLR